MIGDPKMDITVVSTSVKASAIETIGKLPDTATWEDVMYQIYVRQKIEDGLRDVSEGKTLQHEDVMNRFGE